MALGKLGELLNRDLGSLVKDASKVLNTDVGSIAKGAGKMLNADVGDIAKGTKSLLTMDLGDLLKGVNDKTSLDSRIDPVITTQPAAATSTAPDSTPMESVPLPSSVTTPVNPAPPKPTAQRSSETVKFTQDLVLRNKRTPPVGTDLKTLLPWLVGSFERSHSTPSGELASDPVAAIYSADGERVQVVLNMCWDADEALQQVAAVKAQMGEKARATADPSWVIGMTEQGVALIWTRDCYCFTATSARGSAPLANFLATFPY